jgi:hypothetical protein
LLTSAPKIAALVLGAVLVAATSWGADRALGPLNAAGQPVLDTRLRYLLDERTTRVEPDPVLVEATRLGLQPNPFFRDTLVLDLRH